MIINPYARIAPPSFDPTTLPGLVYWLRGDLLTSGGNYSSTLPNSAPGGSDATLNLGTAGATVVNSLNSKNVATFDGATGYTIPSLPAFANSTLYMVARLSAATANMLVFGAQNAGALLWYIDTSERLSMVSPSVVVIGPSTNSLLTHVWDQMNSSFDGSAWAFRKSSVANGSGSASWTPLAGTTNCIANDGSGGASFTGDIAEMLVYDADHTLTQKQQMEAYFTTRWGV